MKLRILSWNVGGANDCDKRRIIKSIVKAQKVDLVCLQETKIQSLSCNGSVIGGGQVLGMGRS